MLDGLLFEMKLQLVVELGIHRFPVKQGTNAVGNIGQHRSST
jgi:hypothetical protein